MPDLDHASAKGVGPLIRLRWAPLHQAFLEQARLAPAAPAIICRDRVSSYGEIAARANRLADQLVAAGAGPNKLVALLMARGAEQVVSVLGILGAGAACLPVEPSWPEPVRRRVFRDERIDLTVILPGLERLAGSSGAARLIAPDDGPPPAAGAAPPWWPGRPHDPLGVWYEWPGAGCLPRRLSVDHATAARTAAAVNRRFGVEREDGLFTLLPIGWTSFYDPLGLLAAGGTLFIPQGPEIDAPAAWLELIEDYEPSLCSATAEQLGALVKHALAGRAASLRSLRLVAVAADRIRLDLAHALRRLLPRVQIVTAAHRQVGEPDLSWLSAARLGPVGATARVLDDGLGECPPGALGGIYLGVGGATTSSFGPAAPAIDRRRVVRARTGEACYWTGRLGRLGRDGSVEIELGEDARSIVPIGHLRSPAQHRLV